MKKKMPKGLKIVLWIVAVLLILAAILCTVAYIYFHSKFGLIQRPDEPAVSTTEQQNDPNTDVEPADEDEQALSDKIKSELEAKEAISAEGEVATADEVMNILLIGTDERTVQFTPKARGDACLLFSVNKKTGKMSLISFERGTGVPILDGQYKGQWDWLTHTFRYGGAELMMKEIRECYKVDVTRYVRANFNTFIAGIDAIGGVDINLTQEESDYFHDGNGFGKDYVNFSQVQHTTAGVNHLNGTTALLYARCRKLDSDWGRVVRQRNVIQAALNQVKDLSIAELNNLLNTVLPLVQTNLTEKDLLSLLMNATEMMKNDVAQVTIPLKGTYGSMTGMGGRSLFAVDFATNAEYLQEMLYGKAKEKE